MRICPRHYPQCDLAIYRHGEAKPYVDMIHQTPFETLTQRTTAKTRRSEQYALDAPKNAALRRLVAITTRRVACAGVDSQKRNNLLPQVAHQPDYQVDGCIVHEDAQVRCVGAGHMLLHLQCMHMQVISARTTNSMRQQSVDALRGCRCGLKQFCQAELTIGPSCRHDCSERRFTVPSPRPCLVSNGAGGTSPPRSLKCLTSYM